MTLPKKHRPGHDTSLNSQAQPKTDAERAAERERDAHLRKNYPKLYAALRRKPAPKPRKPASHRDDSGDLPPAA